MFDLFVSFDYFCHMSKKSKKASVREETPPQASSTVDPADPTGTETTAASVESRALTAKEFGFVTGESAYPPPEIVAEAAREEANPRLVGDYAEAIAILRDEKRFTFREIAEWLKSKFGIEADHNAVYRTYTKGMSEEQAIMEELKDDEDERDDAL